MARPRKADTEHSERINVSLPPADVERLVRYCQKEERSMSWVARKAIAEYLDKRGE